MWAQPLRLPSTLRGGKGLMTSLSVPQNSAFSLEEKWLLLLGDRSNFVPASHTITADS